MSDLKPGDGIAVAMSDTEARLRAEVARLTRERDEEKAERIKWWEAATSPPVSPPRRIQIQEGMMSAIEDHWYEVGYKKGMSDAGAEITRLRAEVERLTARLNFSKNDFEITKLRAALQGVRSRGDEMAARAESAERKLAMAVEALRPFATLRTTRLMTDGCKYNFRVDSGWIRRARAALTELEKADG